MKPHDTEYITHTFTQHIFTENVFHIIVRLKRHDVYPMVSKSDNYYLHQGGCFCLCVSVSRI